MLTPTGQYAIRAMVHLARQPAGSRVLGRVLGGELSIPEHYVSHVLGALARHGLLASRRGRGGGYRLARPAAYITVLDALDAVGRNANVKSCLLGGQACGGNGPCAIHFRWGVLKAEIVDLLQNTSIADLAGSSKRRGDR